MVINRTKNGSYFFKSSTNTCNPWNKSKKICGWDLKSNIFENHADYLILKIIQQYYMKIMLYTSHKLKKYALKVIKLSIYPPKFFYIHQFQKSIEIIVQWVRSNDNLADLFTKALPTTILKKLIYNTGIR